MDSEQAKQVPTVNDDFDIPENAFDDPPLRDLSPPREVPADMQVDHDHDAQQDVGAMEAETEDNVADMFETSMTTRQWRPTLMAWSMQWS